MKRPIELACVAVFCSILSTTAAGVTVHIMPDGTGDLPDIQTALNVCAMGDTILVAPGIFHEQIVWPATNGLTLLGETTPEDCILDGENVYRPITISYPIDETTVIKGLTIQNGIGSAIMCTSGATPVIEDNIIRKSWGNAGGGIYCYGASPTIRNNTIHDCSADDGGGISCNDSFPTIRGNIIQDCSAEAGGGIRCMSGSSPLIIDNDIYANTSTGAGGGGIAVGPDADPTITENWIHDNEGTWGGGIGVTSGCNPTITENLIANNFAESGGGLFLWGAPNLTSGLIAYNEIRANVSPGVGGISLNYALDVIVRDNLITGNVSTGSAGAIGSSGAGNTPTIHGNLILENSGMEAGGIRVRIDAMPTIEENLIRDNLGDGICCMDGANPLVVHNDIYGHDGAFGLNNEDLLITVLAEDNWWGASSGPFNPTSNPDGTGDWVSANVDFDPWSLITGGDTPDTPAPPTLLQNHPNPFNPATVIAFTVPSDQRIRLTVNGLDGGQIATLADAWMAAGRHEVKWTGVDQSGHPMPSGVYFYRLTCGDFTQTNRMVLIR